MGRDKTPKLSIFQRLLEVNLPNPPSSPESSRGEILKVIPCARRELYVQAPV